ncbi:MAG: terminase small subunit [[Clostridium] scindens]
MLRNVKVAAYIAERMEERQKRTEVTQDRVVQELAAIAFARATDYAEIVDGSVRIRNTGDCLTSRSAIAGIKEGANGIEVKLNDKQKALELLGRHLGMWNDKLDINAPAIDDSIKKWRHTLNGGASGSDLLWNEPYKNWALVGFKDPLLYITSG